MKHDFLHNEYHECFEQMRFYDEKQFSLLKFAVSFSSSVATGLLAFYKFWGQITAIFWLASALIGSVVAVGLLLIFWKMVQNRLYFLYPARQVNALRVFLIENESPEFMKFNQMYISTDFSAVKDLSTQILMMIGGILLNAIFVAFSIFAFIRFGELDTQTALIWGILIGIFFALINLIMAFVYLDNKSSVSRDRAIHK